MNLISLIAAIVLMSQLALAGAISYDITASGTSNGQGLNITRNEIKECELNCSFQLPQFELPENFTLTEYQISNVTGQPLKISFNSTGELRSAQANDSVEVQYALPLKELKISKLLTKTLNIGQNNIVVQLDNTGNIDLSDMTVQISGDGIKTVDKQPLKIEKGKTEFATVIVSITNNGTIDTVIKAYEKENLLAQTIETLTVNSPLEQKKEEALNKENLEKVNATYAQQKTNELWKQLDGYEKTYLTKKSEGYSVLDLTDSIDEAKSDIKKLQLESDDLTETAFNKRLDLVSRSLGEINTKLELAAPKKIGDKLRDNLGVIATTIGVLVSSLTAYGLLKTHVGQKKP